MNKNVRIRTNVNQDNVVNVSIGQDIDTLEILSLELNQKDIYRLQESNYGIIVGRVLANDAFGVPNVKVSVFIPISDEDKDNIEIYNLYPYSNISSLDKENRKYNLLPDESNDECYRVVGTFPNKRLVLDNDNVLEVYDKYFKYTTVTNNAGDYMIFGVPVGSQQVHIDLDLSDIGVLSQRPRDMVYKGYNIEQFDSPTQFKESTNLNNLSQIISQTKSVYVYPFWGDNSLDDEIAITRCDIQVDYKFEPTCVFMGSIVTDSNSHSIGSLCNPGKNIGRNDSLVTYEGTIEMIRKSLDGLTESFQINGNKLIDSDGVWCYQIPMNLDYVKTDEYGNIVPTDNPNEGIPTRTRARFRFSLGNSDVEGESKHRSKYLVPNNPKFDEKDTQPTIRENVNDTFNSWFVFGSGTRDEDYRDLYWNKVYSVKSFIPRFQIGSTKKTQKYSAIRSVNRSGDLNPFPFNKLRSRINMGYRLLCLLLTIIAAIILIINLIIGAVHTLLNLYVKLPIIGRVYITRFGCLKINCINMIGGLTDDEEWHVTYSPGCQSSSLKHGCYTCEHEEGSKECSIESKIDVLIDKVQQLLAEEYDTLNLDFYNDWVNGCLYFPLWWWRKRRKKTYFFGLFSRGARSIYCSCERNYTRLYNSHSCGNLTYTNYKQLKTNKNTLKISNDNTGGDDWEHDGSIGPRINHGITHEVTNNDGFKIFYYTPAVINEDEALYDNTMSTTINRMYATDIILLGSFNDCDLDGIPKLYKNLPSTSANIPFLTSIREGLEDYSNQKGKAYNGGDLLVSGMDWGDTDTHLDVSYPAEYSNGLFFDLACSEVYTKLKSCVNVERMCELGVTLDMAYEKSYGGNGDVEYFKVPVDGLVTRYEIDDKESRYMFATLNHNGLDKTINDKTTNYPIYKFSPLYPMDFDGKMKNFVEKVSSKRITDNTDSNYVKFRMGDVAHFYTQKFPVYNNSFYFYFGLHEGSTAIDKFRLQFDTDCTTNKTYPFSYEYTSTIAKTCKKTDSNDFQVNEKPKITTCEKLKESKYVQNESENDFATFTIKLSDIRKPYAYILEDDFDTRIMEEGDMYLDKIEFGRFVVCGGGEYNEKYCGVFQYFNSGKPVIVNNVPYEIDNGTYYLTIIDAQNKRMKIVLNTNYSPISINARSVDLGCKFYSSAINKKEDICSEDFNFAGSLILTDITLDGELYYFKSCQPSQYVKDGIDCVIVSSKNTSITANVCIEIESIKPLLEVESGEENASAYTWFECVCESFRLVKNGTDYSDYNVVATVWKPAIYNLKVTQICNGELNSNTTTVSLMVDNGEPFNAFLNEMPLSFMIGAGTNDNVFYKTKMPNSPSGLKSWFNAFNMNTSDVTATTKVMYNLLDYNDINNIELYKDYVKDLEIDIKDNDVKVLSEDSKWKIILFLYEKTFMLCSGIYVTDDDNVTQTFTVKGGQSPRLKRCVSPQYDNAPESLNNYYIDSVIDTVTVDPNYPTIIGNNYIGFEDVKLPVFNTLLTNNSSVPYCGNYYAGFTLNGGLGDEYKNLKGVQSIPARTNPLSKYSTYKREIEEDASELKPISNNNSYFTAPIIDRRMNVNLKVCVVSDDNITLSGKCNFDDENSWVIKTAYVSGTVFNGIEMAYDDEYNVFQTKNISKPILDYTVDVDKKEVMSTHYNKNVKPLFYDAKINGIDIRNRIVSTFNDYSDINDFSDLTKTQTKDKYEANKNMLSIKPTVGTYNGKFSFENYPTKRALNLLVEKKATQTINLVSCSYYEPQITLVRNDDEQISGLKGIINDGESKEISLNTKNFVTLSNNTIDAEKGNFNILYLDGQASYLRLTYSINSKDASDYTTLTERGMVMLFNDASVIENDFYNNTLRGVKTLYCEQVSKNETNYSFNDDNLLIDANKAVVADSFVNKNVIFGVKPDKNTNAYFDFMKPTAINANVFKGVPNEDNFYSSNSAARLPNDRNYLGLRLVRHYEDNDYKTVKDKLSVINYQVVVNLGKITYSKNKFSIEKDVVVDEGETPKKYYRCSLTVEIDLSELGLERIDDFVDSVGGSLFYNISSNNWQVAHSVDATMFEIDDEKKKCKVLLGFENLNERIETFSMKYPSTNFCYTIYIKSKNGLIYQLGFTNPVQINNL